MLQAHAFVAALGVQRIATARFTRAIVNAVDSSIVDTRSAGDEEDAGCGHEAVVRRGRLALWLCGRVRVRRVRLRVRG